MTISDVRAVIFALVLILAIFVTVDHVVPHGRVVKHVCVIRLSTGQELTIDRCTVTP